MFLEICMQIHSVVFALSREINKQKVCENNNLFVHKVFVKYQAQGGVFNPNPPLRSPCVEPFFLVSVCWPGFTAAEQHVERASHIDTNLDVKREVLVCPDSTAKFSKRRGSFANACI